MAGKIRFGLWLKTLWIPPSAEYCEYYLQAQIQFLKVEKQQICEVQPCCPRMNKRPIENIWDLPKAEMMCKPGSALKLVDDFAEFSHSCRLKSK